jgi:hypothetical protein
LWSVLVLARLDGLDLERAFMSTMDEQEREIAARLRASGKS